MNSIASLAFFFAVLFTSGHLLAQESPMDLREIERKLSALHAKVSGLNAVHDQIISKQTQIKEELESLKIWIRRHRG